MRLRDFSARRSEPSTGAEHRQPPNALRLIPASKANPLRAYAARASVQTRDVLVALSVALSLVLAGVLLWQFRALAITSHVVLPIVALITAGMVGHFHGAAADRPQRLRRLETTLRLRTEERDWQAAELRKLAERVADAERQQSEFAANMSHELRTPLNIILGYADLALDDQRLPADAEARGWLRSIAGSARGLYRLVENVLQYAAFDGGCPPLCVTSFSVDRLFDELRELCTDVCRTPDVCVQIAAAPDLHLTTDFGRLRAALGDLLLNAIKFTPRGTVELTVHPTGDEVRFRVRDTGVGIPSDELARIFEPFRQLDGSSTRTYGGVGLGLAIVRRNVELLHGRIQVESRLGIGSTFGVHILRRLDARRSSPL